MKLVSMVFYPNENNQYLMANQKLNEENTRLLIVPCSKIKRRLFNTSALELYDGPFFRLIRKYKPKNLDIFVLSAKYGMIKSDMPISYYDQKMTKERAKELSGIINRDLAQYLSGKQYKNVYINLGKIYYNALEPSMNLFKNSNVYHASGGIGLRLHQLKNWIC